jgi:hypothetical protein
MLHDCLMEKQSCRSPVGGITESRHIDQKENRKLNSPSKRYFKIDNP